MGEFEYSGYESSEMDCDNSRHESFSQAKTEELSDSESTESYETTEDKVLKPTFLALAFVFKRKNWSFLFKVSRKPAARVGKFMNVHVRFFNGVCSRQTQPQ